MEQERCPWCGSDPQYVEYHDEEWGVPVRDDQMMFEFLVLESFQAGLSWLMILRKRDNFRIAFDHFDYTKIAKYNEQKVESLMEDAGIVRNQSKIRAAINNAQRFMEIQEEYGDFCTYFWEFTDGKPIVNKWEKMAQVPAKTALSDKISKDMKKRGFKFLGSTTLYAHMQACGMVNDHLISCFRYDAV
jgi:DNA-3-methyladenine glycosylase I